MIPTLMTWELLVPARWCAPSDDRLRALSGFVAARDIQSLLSLPQETPMVEASRTESAFVIACPRKTDTSEIIFKIKSV